MQIFIILLLVRIMGWLLALIKQPPVIGEIIVGVIIGHSVLGTSLELEQKQLKRRWEDSLPISIATIIVPYGAGAALSIYLYDINNRDGFKPPDRIAFILFAASSNYPFGTLTVSCAAMNDVMGWCSWLLLAHLPKGQVLLASGKVILISVGYVLFMFTIVRWSINRVHALLIQRNIEMNHSFLIGIFLLLLGSSFFPIHLVYIHFSVHLLGMRTSLGSLNDPLHGGITVLIFAVATLIKFLPATLMTKCVTHRSWRFSTSVGILMNTRGLVELIALNIDLQLNILSPGLFSMFFL
ncbi:unnamed protein product [Rotaria magnacalcarata]|uniref:Cation/H+ exchanger transmembrane domain-containing protein n=1 Tax=Rotaria magnacalcarata TaxID=392030 RepID=A0A8S2M740_9BILA|nr:unnamed protein product [Rotaria magnacalcarata]